MKRFFRILVEVLHSLRFQAVIIVIALVNIVLGFAGLYKDWDIFGFLYGLGIGLLLPSFLESVYLKYKQKNRQTKTQ